MDTDPAPDSAPAAPQSTSGRASPAPEAAPAPATTDDASHPADRPRHKRTRAAMDPGTPKGEGDEPKGLTGVTPLAKKGRVQGEEPRESDADLSDNDDDAMERAGTPPPSASASGAAPATPAQGQKAVRVPATEGKDTRSLRERVAAMKPPGQAGEGELDSEALVPSADEKDADIADVSEEVAESAAKLGDEHDKDMEAAEVAAEVSSSAAQLANEQNLKEEREKDVEIAEVAAEVGTSAAQVDAKDVQVKDEADVAAEVAESAAEVQAEDEKIADTAAETAEASKAIPEENADKPAPPAQTSFSNYSSTASPFSSFSSTASPFASVSTPSQPAPAPADAQKAKAKSSFSASPFLSSSLPPAAKPVASTSSATSSGLSVPAPSTPLAKPVASTSSLAANSPFSAFASTSGFASATKKPTGTPSAFSSYSAAPSAFASVPATPLSKPSTSTSDAEAGSETPGATGRKIGEPEQPDEGRRVYTEQETHTGEEEDELVHQVRAKLFAMHEGNWAERGMGPLKLNKTKAKEGEKGGARIVMRAEATHRLLLNATLFPEFFIEVSNEKYVRFTIIEGTEPISYMLRLGNPAAAQSLVDAVRERTAAL
ncbi:hypothetical protein JCM5296_003667 [Sporobolomyces johnsonii]